MKDQLRPFAHQAGRAVCAWGARRFGGALHALGRTPIYLYLTAFGGVVLTGAGALSFDRLIQGKG